LTSNDQNLMLYGLLDSSHQDKHFDSKFINIRAKLIEK